MSSFIKDWYYCIDDFFWPNIYGFVKMTEQEEKANIGEKWTLLDFKTLQWRGGTREVLREIPSEFQNIPVAISRIGSNHYSLQKFKS